ncbi:hypothetical protein AK812_SmicGene14072 [Symbiodinium microadriaticum]|uniref:Tyr recombinase domain-containing protein n=1 Tax=Symbiodinium microadriaticum TaxID=2951 RepID=A0A1Q9E6J2_SYMMI|nr:hypothetical protein AK812_SmicGene14072 [Symbiodinium microadriaticum]
MRGCVGLYLHWLLLLLRCLVPMQKDALAQKLDVRAHLQRQHRVCPAEDGQAFYFKDANGHLRLTGLAVGSAGTWIRNYGGSSDRLACQRLEPGCCVSRRWCCGAMRIFTALAKRRDAHVADEPSSGMLRVAALTLSRGAQFNFADELSSGMLRFRGAGAVVRCTFVYPRDVLALRACDFNWRSHRVRIKALKGGKEVLKWIISSSRASLQRLRDKGLVVRRKRQAGARGQVTVREEWKWPRGDALLFESEGRPGKPRTKDVVSHAIVRARKTFQAEHIDRSRIRSHSGRHRMIQDMKASGVADHVGMAHARIKSVKTYQSYGQLEDAQTAKALESNRKLKATVKQIYKKKCSPTAWRLRVSTADPRGYEFLQQLFFSGSYEFLQQRFFSGSTQHFEVLRLRGGYEFLQQIPVPDAFVRRLRDAWSESGHRLAACGA